MKKNWILLLLFITVISFGQESQLTVEYITIQNGLANNQVNSIIKDKTGLIWFGTNDGISRFDGYTIKNFKPENKILFILDLLQTNDGLLWCASTDGLYCFDPVTERFIGNIKLNSEHPSYSLVSRISGIAKGKDDSLWLTTNKGLYHITNIDKEQLLSQSQKIAFFNMNNSLIPSNLLTTIFNDDNILWIGSQDQFVFTFNIETAVFKKIPIEIYSKREKKIAVVNCFYNNGDHLWVGTLGGGAVIINKSTFDFKMLENEEASGISHDDVYGIGKDAAGNVWVGTWNGIDRINSQEKILDYTSIDHFNWDHPLFYEKLENRISTLLWDESGVMWVGTFGGGVVKININSNNYKRYKFNSLYEVKSIIEDNDGYLWISLFHGGIKKSIQKTGKLINYTFKDFKKEKASSGLESNIILCSAKDLDGVLWFGTDQSTLYSYNNKDQTFQKLKITPTNDADWKGQVLVLCIDSKGNYWIGTNNGLVYYDVYLRTFEVIKASDKKEYALNSNLIRSVFEDSKGGIWIGTNYGINKLIYHEDGTFQFNNFNDIYMPNGVLHSKDVWSIFEDSNNNLWFGYVGGLGEYNSLKGEIQVYNTTHGLPNNFVTSIIEDAIGNLWIGTGSGISKFDIKNKKFENYFIANNNRAAYKDSNGNLYFGNNKGLLSFHPENIKQNTFIPPIIISGLKIDNKHVNIDEIMNEQTILNKSILYTKHLDLNHHNHNFALEFTGLSYSFQESNTYAYKLEGFENDWTTVNSRARTVNFNNLKPGDYSFLVKATNNDGIWNNTPNRLSITIKPAWWNTPLARILFLLFIIIILATFYYIRVNQIYKEKERSEDKIKSQHNLKIAKLEKIREQELGKMKSKFFTNLSHEIRTPLTLIIAPLQDIINSKELSNKIKGQLIPVEKNAKNLLKLINQLLDFTKIVNNKMTLQISEGDINSFAKNIFNNFKPLAKLNNIKFKFSSDKKVFPMWFDTKNIEIVITNILSNAFKFTPKGGSISIKISQLNLDAKKHCKILISDSGKGISKNNQSHLFERFYQVPNKNENKNIGSGLGLSIVKEIIDLHKGEIVLDSEIGKGSIFQIILPIEKDQYPTDYIMNTSNIQDNKSENIAQDITEAPIDYIPTKKSQTKKGSILIVEDTIEILNYIKSIFSEEYEIYEAENGKKGLELATKHFPDLIISDIMMPIMDGITLCKTLKKNMKTSHIPIILLTAKADRLDKIEGLSFGADDYITKPFESAILKAKAESFIENRKRLKDFFGKKITLEPTNIELDSHEEKFLKAAIDTIEKNLMNPEFSVTILASHLNMSQATLYRKVKTFTNLSISQFIRSIRIKRGAQLLSLNDHSIGEITTMVGFTDQGYFRKCFLEQFGVNPSMYLKSITPIKKKNS